ncbi:hypothetical protein BaRGS_00025925, partial [Batillaria attramentaria]
ATAYVLITASIYAFCWYSSERSLYDLAEKKSYAGSSQRGVYRSRNSLHVVNLPPMGDLPLPPDRDDLDGQPNDDSLKQVPEMPEEEEAEAIEMEEFTQQKLKDLDASTNYNENEGHRPSTQERNLIKSQYHAQSKNVHKDLLKKDKTSAKTASKRRTANGTYTGLALGPESASADESMDSENDMDLDLTGDSVRDVFPSSDRNYENLDGRKPLTTFMSPHRGRQGYSIGGTAPENVGLLKNAHPETYRHASNKDDAGDVGLQVMADVHKTGMQPEIVKVSTPDKQVHPGFAGVLSPDTSRPALTTFSSPVQSPVVPPHPSKAIRFKEPADEEERTSSQNLNPPQRPPVNPVARFAPGFLTMGDIPEDPREDCDSVQSERSRSMYGSSEIFDANAPEHTYYNLEDSDIDIPPLDAEDILSDGGLPSPLTTSLGRGRTQDDSSVSGQRVFLFNRDPALISKPRPYSSIILRSEHSRPSSDSGISSGISSDQTSTPVNSEVDAMSPQLPPPPVPPEQAGQDGNGNAFHFPPPPRFFSVPQRVSWNSPPATPASAGEYVTLPNNSTKGGDTKPEANARGTAGGRPGFGSAYMNLTLLSVICVLGLATSVYCKMDENDKTRVDITIFAPKNFLSAGTSTVYFNLKKDTDLEVDDGFDFKAFVMPDPVLKEKENDLCTSSSCQQGCDVQTGNCICQKGFRFNEYATEKEEQCLDVNECADGLTKCHPLAGCLNRRGSYDYCNEPCRDDQYEVQPCSKKSQKLCKDCTKVCHKGFYMDSQCTENADAMCRVCQPKCLPGKYEYRTCSNYHDRLCRNVTSLPDVEASDNVILEEERKVKDSVVIVEHLPSLIIGYTLYSLQRGTGLHVDISFQNMEAAQQFTPLTNQGGNVSASSPAVLKKETVQRFCPNPVPDYYILHYTKHQDVTYQKDKKGEVSACHTYQDHGTFPADVLQKDNSFFVTEPGPLTKLFEIDPDIFQTSTTWAEKSKRPCEQCTRQCAQQMGRDNGDCTIIGDSSDNGWSPRLQVCYNCCARSNCTDVCKNYHHRRSCQPRECVTGNLVEFSVFPSWRGSQKGKFFCHIRPVERQRLVEMRYTVRSEKRKEPVHRAKVVVDGGKEWEETGKTFYSDGLLNIMIDSKLGKLPDFLEGETSAANIFRAGTYIQEGSRMDKAVVSGESVFIHPLKPFGINIPTTDHEVQEAQLLKDSIMVDNQRQEPYTPDNDILAVAFQNKSLPFIITHPNHPPTVRITANKRSFLRQLFPEAVLQEGSLSGNMRHNTTHWIIEVSGTVKECPGYLRVVLSDPAYSTTPLYTCDVAVTCPNTFHLYFYLPTGDAVGLDRQVVASVADVRKVHNLRLHRPAAFGVDANQDRKEAPVSLAMPPPAKTQGLSGLNLPDGFIFSIPYMVSVGGAIFLLLCLLIIGLIVQPGIPAPEPPILRCHHAVFMVVYIVFHFLYSIIASASLFFLIIIAVNGGRVAFIQQHQQQAAATSASHQLELTAMQTFLEREMKRQDTHMDDMRGLCQQDMQALVADMKKLHEAIVSKTEDVFAKHRLENVLEQHRHRSLQQLAQDLLTFRDKYDTAMRTMLRELNHNVMQSYQSIEDNPWLKGALFLHGSVINIRKHIKNVDSKPFLEWAHLETDLNKLAVDVSFSLPSLPRLTDLEQVLEAEQTGPTKRSSEDDKSQKHVKTTRIYNQWMSAFSQNASREAMKMQRNGRDGDKESREKSFVVFYIFLGLLACFDLLLLLHRMLKACSMGRLLLYGFPEYMDFRERKEDGDDDVFDDGRKCRCWTESPFCQAVRAFFSQLISSSFLPKAAIVVAVAIMLRGVLRLSTTVLTVESLQQSGLYHSSEEYLNLHAQLINGRVRAHAEHINTIDFPAYQTWMSTYIQRHQFAFQVYRQQFTQMQHVHTQTYCHYLESLGLAGNCSHDHSQGDNQDSAYGVISPGCQFQPVLPKYYKRSESVYRNLSEQQLGVMLENVRAIIFDTCQVIVVFLSIIVLKELICAVVWIFIRRSGLIRLRIIYETDQDEPGQVTE